MITVSKQENGVLFTFTNSDKYLYGSGTIEVPFNSLSIIQDGSDNITLRKSASWDIFLSARYDTDFGYASKEEAVNALKEILYDEAGISEEEVQQMIDAATSGIPSSEVVEQLRRDVNAVSGEVDTKQDILTAGENITISGNVISADAGNNIIELTQAEYDALVDKDPDVLYIITDAQEINMNDYYTKNQIDGFLNNAEQVIATKADTSALTAVNNVLTAHTADTTVHVTQDEKNTWNGKLDASAYTPTDLSEYWTSGQTQEAINAATSGIPSSQVIEALRNDVNTVSGDVENKQDKLEYYSEAEYPTGGGGRGMINVSNGKTYSSSVEADAGSSDGLTYAILYAKGDAGSNTLKVSPDGVTINDAKVLTENDIDVNEIWNTIDEKEEVIASALTQLNQDVTDIDAKEEVIASALTELNLRVTEDEEVTAAALNNLDETKQGKLVYYSENTEEGFADIYMTNDDGQGNVDEYSFNVGTGSVDLGHYNQYDDGQGNSGYTHTQIMLANPETNLISESEENGETESTTLTVYPTGVTINNENVATEPYVDAALSGKADTTYLNQIAAQATEAITELNTRIGTVETTLGGQIETLNANKFGYASYDSQTQRINFYSHSNSPDVLTYIDATAFIKDGMVNNVEIINGNLVITFNSDAGKQPISIPLTDIFNPANYYTTAQTQSYVSGFTYDKATIDQKVAEGGTFDPTLYYNKTATDALLAAKVDTSALTAVESDVQTLSGAVIDNEYTVSQAINSLNNRVTAVEEDTLTAGTGISISNNVISTSGVVMSQQVTQIVKLTQAQYDALTTKDNSVLYVIVD